MYLISFAYNKHKLDFFFRDFPGGEGESLFVGRASVQDIRTREGRQAMGFEPFMIPPGMTNSTSFELFEAANRILFG